MNPRLQTSLAVQWLRHLASTAGGTGLILGRGIKILGRGIKILHSEWHSQKVERKKRNPQAGDVEEGEAMVRRMLNSRLFPVFRFCALIYLD